MVQQLVPADVAGVLFTANPMTGSRDQVMINAAWGLGEAIVGGHVTPDTLIVDKPTGVIESQEIADKDVMTVRSAGGTREEPVPADRRKQPRFNRPRPPSWRAWACRSSNSTACRWTSNGRCTTAASSSFRRGRSPRCPSRARRSIGPCRARRGDTRAASVIELLPDPLSPLFATLALPLWNEGYRELLRAIGLTGMFPEEFL